MCGIAGYVGDRESADVLVDALSKLEYRGYDSAGIAVFDHGNIKVKKCKGRLANLVEKMDEEGKPQGHVGIGHTRWATHGEPSDINSHPHGNKRVTIVHNGIIENYKKLKDFLIGEGYSFASETDTEVAAKLLDYYYDGDPMKTIAKVLSEIKGSYALGIMFRDFPDEIFAVRKDSPLIVGVGEHENFIASDVPAIIHYTRDYYLLDQNEIAVIKKDSVKIYDVHGNEIHKELNTADWDVDAAVKTMLGYVRPIMTPVIEARQKQAEEEFEKMMNPPAEEKVEDAPADEQAGMKEQQEEEPKAEDEQTDDVPADEVPDKEAGDKNCQEEAEDEQTEEPEEEKSETEESPAEEQQTESKMPEEDGEELEECQQGDASDDSSEASASTEANDDPFSLDFDDEDEDFMNIPAGVDAESDESDGADVDNDEDSADENNSDAADPFSLDDFDDTDKEDTDSSDEPEKPEEHEEPDDVPEEEAEPVEEPVEESTSEPAENPAEENPDNVSEIQEEPEESSDEEDDDDGEAILID